MALQLDRPNDGLMTVEAELSVPLATVQLVHFDLPHPSDEIFHQQEEYWLDLCLTPRPHNSRGCYREHWSADRFEPIGDMLFVPAGKILHARHDGGRQDSILCLLHAAPLRALFEDDFEWSDRPLETSLDLASTRIRSLILRLGEELRSPGFASEMLAELIAAQMAIELFRYRASVAGAPPSGGLTPWRLRIIDERLVERRAAPSLAELAGLCKLSVRQLTRGFRTSRGCSIGEYVARSQVEHAKRLLATDQSIKSIAHSLGFASHSSFSYAFRRATGQTPREFRENQFLPQLGQEADSRESARRAASRR